MRVRDTSPPMLLSLFYQTTQWLEAPSTARVTSSCLCEGRRSGDERGDSVFREAKATPGFGAAGIGVHVRRKTECLELLAQQLRHERVYLPQLFFEVRA